MSKSCPDALLAKTVFLPVRLFPALSSPCCTPQNPVCVGAAVAAHNRPHVSRGVSCIPPPSPAACPCDSPTSSCCSQGAHFSPLGKLSGKEENKQIIGLGRLSGK